MTDKLSELGKSREGFPKLKTEKLKKLYKMFIDRQWHDEEEGDMQFFFENERGYLAGVMNGFVEMLNTLDAEISVESYMSLHDTCVHDVHDRKTGEPLDKGYRDEEHGTGFPIVVGEEGNFSAAGFKELKLKMESDTSDEPWHLFGVLKKNGERGLTASPESDDQVKHLQCTPQTPQACKNKIESVLKKYYTDIKLVKIEDIDGKLTVIAKCCQDLDQAHAFADGNIRVVAFVLLNKFLIENGLVPTILKEPNRFDGYAVHELVEDIKEGQVKFSEELL